MSTLTDLEEKNNNIKQVKAVKNALKEALEKANSLSSMEIQSFQVDGNNNSNNFFNNISSDLKSSYDKIVNDILPWLDDDLAAVYDDINDEEEGGYYG